MEITVAVIAGAGLQDDPMMLADNVGVACENVRPPTDGTARPWNEPAALSPAPTLVSNPQTIYRMGRDISTPASYWLSFTALSHIIRGFDSSDPTERTYWTDGVAPKWTDNVVGLAGAPYPTASRLLAVPQPTVAPGVTLAVNGSTGTDQTVYYVYTWVNDIGWESAPSPPTLSPVHKPGATFDLTASSSVPSGAYGVNRIRWYRTQTTGTAGDAEFFFLREYALAASGMQDDARELGADVLPTDAATLRLPLESDSTFLTQCWNEFAAAIVGKAVRCCEPGLIYSWPLGNEYTLPDTPLAIAAFSQRIVALTAGGAYIYTGSDPEALDRKGPLAFAPPVSKRSLVTGEAWCAWAADDGFYYYGAADGYRSLTQAAISAKAWRALNPSTMHCSLVAVDGRTYIACWYNASGWKGLLIDPAGAAPGVFFLTQGYSASYWDPLLRKLLVLDGSTLKEWDPATGTPMSAHFRSKVFRQMAHDDSAEWIEMVGTGALTAKVLTTDQTNVTGPLIERMSRSITQGEHRLPDAAAGRDWQLDLTWTGTLKGVSIT